MQNQFENKQLCCVSISQTHMEATDFENVISFPLLISIRSWLRIPNYDFSRAENGNVIGMQNRAVYTAIVIECGFEDLLLVDIYRGLFMISGDHWHMRAANNSMMMKRRWWSENFFCEMENRTFIKKLRNGLGMTESLKFAITHQPDVDSIQLHIFVVLKLKKILRLPVAL